MKSTTEIKELINFPQINDFFDKPIKPGNVIIYNNSLYLVTDFTNLKIENQYIKLIYFETNPKTFLSYPNFARLSIKNINKANPIFNITAIIPDNIKTLAATYFHLFKTRPDFKNIEIKDIFQKYLNFI